MPPFREIFLNAIQNMTLPTRKYNVIESDEDFQDLLLNPNPVLDYVDFSKFDLRPYTDVFLSKPTGPFSVPGINGWTDTVIWPSPDKMPTGFDPKKMLNDAKTTPEIKKLRSTNKTGAGINIAIIDNILDFRHPEFTDNIKYVAEPVLKMKNSAPHFHGSMVTGCAVGKQTGVAPDANIYYFTRAKANEETTEEMQRVLKNIIEFNNNQPPHKRIHILSFSGTPQGVSNNSTASETNIIQMLQQLESMGIKIIICGDTIKKRQYYPESFSIAKHDFIPTSHDTPVLGDKRIEYTSDVIGIPTNCKTTPITTGYAYKKICGDSASAPYLAGVFACALQGNTIFCSRPNWQNELNEIMRATAIEHPHGGKIINPSGIVERVSEIARTMEMDLIKHQASQHE